MSRRSAHRESGSVQRGHQLSRDDPRSAPVHMEDSERREGRNARHPGRITVISTLHALRFTCCCRYRLLPLEHSDLNDVESTVAQQKIREEMADLIRQLEEETNERIKEEKAQAAKARALTDALMQGLEIVNRNMYASPVSS
mmetsp:Transcript_39137/g.123390  ORF Transcript_39137/g.123390 Transcript_39137/m.123390 type:complete len:142 (+) Transcript_39137:484-909(+)